MAGLRILIVNADAATAGELGATLAGFGYEVAGIVSSGQEMIASAAQTDPNLVIVDIGVEGETDVAQTARTIRLCRPIPIIFLTLTADTAESISRLAEAIEPYAVLVRPFTERELVSRIEMIHCKYEAKKQAVELEERFFTLSIDMLCFADFNGNFKRLNPAWEKTLGFTREELMSRPAIEFVHPDDRERTRNQNREVQAGGQARSFENRYRCKDGSYKWLLWNATFDFDQKVIYSVARDITERKQDEAEREALLQNLQTALTEVKTLQEILPICSYCRKIRNDMNYWLTVEGYISQHTNSKFSHSICPTCYATEVEPELEKMDIR